MDNLLIVNNSIDRIDVKVVIVLSIDMIGSFARLICLRDDHAVVYLLWMFSVLLGNQLTNGQTH